MKKHFLLAGFLLMAGCLNAQSKPGDLAPYQKDKSLPSFNIQLTDSVTYFTKEQLPKYPFTAIIYFSPDCGHCQHMAQDLIKHMDTLKNTFFVLVAYKSISDIKGFAEYYQLNKFENLRIGRDPKYYVPSFYHVQSTPFVALYNKNQQLVKAWDPPHNPVMELPELVEWVNKH